MKVYLVYEYAQFGDNERHLIAGRTTMELAQKVSKERANADFEYMKKHPERYRIVSPMVVREYTEDNEWIYEYGEERSVTLTGEWTGGWGRYAVVPFDIEGETA